MPTIKPRVTITMTEEQLQKIEDLRFKKRFKNQTQAILSLIDAGFETLKATSTSVEDIIIQNHNKQMTKRYHALDEHGKEMVDFVLEKEYSRCKNEYIELVARGGKYKVKKDDAIEWAKQLDLDNYEEDHDLG